MAHDCQEVLLPFACTLRFEIWDQTLLDIVVTTSEDCSLCLRAAFAIAGCVLYFCLYGTSPFERDLGASLSLAIQNGKVEWPQSRSATAELKEMVQYCLNLNPEERPSIEEVLSKAETLIGEGPE